MDPEPAVVEERVNHWLEHELGNAEIIKTETTGVAAATGSEGRSYPYIIVTIWFEGR